MQVAATVAGQVISSAMSDDGSDAADAQVAAADRAAQMQAEAAKEQVKQTREMFDLSRGDILKAQEQSRADSAPVRMAGYNALDSYLDTLGVARADAGSFQLSQAMNANLPAGGGSTPLTVEAATKNRAEILSKAVKSVADGPAPNFGSAKTQAQQLLSANASDADKLAFLQGIQEKFQYYGSPGRQSSTNGTKQMWKGVSDQINLGIADYNKFEMPQPLTAEQQAQKTLSQQFKDGTVPQSVANSTSVLQKFLNTPEYKLLFGNGAAADANASPLQRFQADPGYQFMLDEGVKNIDRSAAAKGMLLSGNQLQEVGKFNTGLANTTWNDWVNKQSNMFRSYQGNLANVAGMGNSATAQAGQNAINAGNANAALAGNNASTLNAISQNLADAQGNAAIAAGNARASSYTNKANANNQMWGSIGSTVSSGLNSMNNSSRWMNPDTGRYW